MMHFKKSLLLFAAALAWLSLPASPAQAQWIGFGVGIPAFRPYPFYRPYYVRPYFPYRYRVYAPVPAYVTPPPVYYYPQPAPVIQQNYYSYPTWGNIAIPVSPAPGMAPMMPPTLTPVPPQPMTPVAPSTPTTFAPPAPQPPTPATQLGPPLTLPTPETIPALPGQP